MSPGAIDNYVAPRSIKNIVIEVMEYVKKHIEENLKEGESCVYPIDFDTYDQALHAIWPDLFKASPDAALLVSISIYIDISEHWGFEVQPEEIKALRL